MFLSHPRTLPVAVEPSSLRGLLGTTLRDVIVEGYVDREDGVLRFANLGRRVQLAFGDRWLVCTEVPHDGRMLLALHEAFTPPADPRLVDEDLSDACASILASVLWSQPAEPSLVAMRAHRPLFDEAGELVGCDALRMELSTGEIVFVDPSHVGGIRVGDERDEERWRERWVRAEERAPWIVAMGSG